MEVGVGEGGGGGGGGAGGGGGEEVVRASCVAGGVQAWARCVRARTQCSVSCVRACMRACVRVVGVGMRKRHVAESSWRRAGGG